MAELVDLVGFVAEQTIRFLPWFLLAVALGALMQAVSVDGLARRAFSRGVTGIALATAIGAFSPFCSFTVIPVIRGFLKAGVPLSVVMAFWFASPTMDPEIFALTAGILGIPLAVARLLAALTVSMAAGLAVLALERRGMLRAPLREESEVAPPARPRRGVRALVTARSGAVPAIAGGSDGDGAGTIADAPSCAGAQPAPTGGCGAAAVEAPGGGCGAASTAPLDDDRPWWRTLAWELRHLDVAQFLRTVVKDTVSLGRWLVLAFVLQGLIVFYVPQQVVLQTLGIGGILSVPLAGVLAVPLYLNGVSAIPVVAGLIEKGMQPGAAVTFLIAGAVTTLPAIAAVRGVVDNRITGLYLALGFVGSVAVGLVAAAFL